MSWFNIGTDEVNEAESLYAPKVGSISGEHVVTIAQVYLMESGSSSAKALVVDYVHENGSRGTEKFWYINKDTGTEKKPDGTPTIGSLQVANFFGAIKVKPESVEPKRTMYKVFGQDKEVFAFPTLVGREVRVVVQMKEEEKYSDGSIIEVAEVIGWFDVKTRKNRKELAEDTDALQIEKDIKRSEKLRKMKAKKEPVSSKKEPEEERPW